MLAGVDKESKEQKWLLLGTLPVSEKDFSLSKIMLQLHEKRL
jgi:hypothetical protein